MERIAMLLWSQRIRRVQWKAIRWHHLQYFQIYLIDLNISSAIHILRSMNWTCNLFLWTFSNNLYQHPHAIWCMKKKGMQRKRLQQYRSKILHVWCSQVNLRCVLKSSLILWWLYFAGWLCSALYFLNCLRHWQEHFISHSKKNSFTPLHHSNAWRNCWCESACDMLR